MRLQSTVLAFLVLAVGAAPALVGCGSLYDEFYKPLEEGAGAAGGGAGGKGGSTGGTGGSAGGTAGSTTGGAGGSAGGSTGGTGPVCGDGNVEAPEECDDQNTTEGDGCFDCKLDCGCPDCQAGTPCVDCPVAGQISFKDAGSKHCYQFVPDYVTWDVAEAACVAWGGNLAATSTVEEMGILAVPTLIPVLTNPDERCWVGGNDLAAEGTFIWTNGETWLEPGAGGPPWSTGLPDGGSAENCVAIASDQAIRDRACAETHTYLCERGP